MKKFLIIFLIIIAIAVVALVVLNINNTSFTLPNAQTNEFPDDYSEAPVDNNITIPDPVIEVHYHDPEIPW